ncbi:MAG TPA: 4Fe-4S dicluster domain-containing protein [Clostridia bacterium]|nr:4Fe-4S dicluster domain-containing protein [Clostridia bacterium]
MENIELTSALDNSKDFIAKLNGATGVQVLDCYQCGKCSAGCPFNFAMDHTPHKIMRMLQLGLTEQALSSKSIWVCAACGTCYARCPKGVDIPKVMEALRIEAKKRNKIPIKDIDIFSDLFLMTVKQFGRVPEALLIMLFNLKSGHLLKDVPLAPALLLNGKVHPIPKRYKGHEAAKRIFANCQKLGGNG